MRECTLLIAFAACHTAGPFDYVAPSAGNDSQTELGSLDRALSAALRADYHKQIERVDPPLGLTPTDGSELALNALAANVTIAGPLAHTELHFTFHNAESRQREGRFRIELPDGAAVGTFSMKVGNEWREARIVAREQGREVYETFLHRKVDPALLEQDAGNQFNARVFPIPPQADKEIIVGYDQLVSEQRPYTLQLKGLPVIPRLTVNIDRDGEKTTSDRASVLPDDIRVGIAGGDLAIGDGQLFVARVEPVGETERPLPLDRVYILIDTSASRSTLMGKQAELLQQLLAALPSATAVTVAAYDNDVSELFRGRAGDAGDAIGKLYDHGALGASNLGRAIDRAIASGMTRVVIIGDGVATAGDPAAKIALQIQASQLHRVDAIQIGSSIDRDSLGTLVRAAKLPGAILGAGEARRVIAQLAAPIPREVAVAVEGASGVWPKTTRGVGPGEPIWVTGRRMGDGPLAVRIGDRLVSLSPRTADRAQLTRTVARAEIADLTAQAAATGDADRRALLDKQVEGIALANNLMSARTSMLVLESDADEARTLGPRAGTKSDAATSSRGAGGEVITIRDAAPTIDVASTSQGITLDRNYIRNIPVPGRTFESSMRGSTVSGATSIENTYYVDGINTQGLRVTGDVNSTLAQDHVARAMQSTAFAFGVPVSPGSPTVQRGEELVFASPYEGVLEQIMKALAANQRDRALALATRYRLDNPGDVAAIIGLGEALEARGAKTLAARAYASIIDLYPNRAELVRAAAERLDRLAEGRVTGARDLAIDAYRRALADRPDQISTYRLLAYALVRAGQADRALDLLLEGRTRATRQSVKDILLRDARVVGAVIVARDTSKGVAVRGKLGVPVADKPSLQLVLSWETDANDVDLHVVDRRGDHAWYSNRTLGSGGELLDDLTDGFGPEMFVVDQPRAFPYTIAVHYYNRGPEGLGIGTVQVVRHDGNGNLEVEDRPFVLQKDQATIGLGKVTR